MSGSNDNVFLEDFDFDRFCQDWISSHQSGCASGRELGPESSLVDDFGLSTSEVGSIFNGVQTQVRKQPLPLATSAASPLESAPLISGNILNSTPLQGATVHHPILAEIHAPLQFPLPQILPNTAAASSPAIITDVQADTVQSNLILYPLTLQTSNILPNPFSPRLATANHSTQVSYIEQDEPYDISHWAARGGVVHSDHSQPDSKQYGRGCYNCLRGHQKCECRTVCQSPAPGCNALESLKKHRSIIFVPWAEAKTLLEQTKARFWEILPDVCTYGSDVPRAIQRMVLDARIGQSSTSEVARFDPSLEDANSLTVDDNMNNGPALQITALRPIMHDVWLDNADARSNSPQFHPKKLVFAAKMFIALWSLLATFDAIELVAPLFDNVSILMLQKDGKNLADHRKEVTRKRKMLASGLLSGLLWNLQSSFDELLKQFDEAVEQAKASSGSGVLLRNCIRLVMDALLDQEIEWRFENSQDNKSLVDLHYLLEEGRCLLQQQLARYECYVGHAMNTKRRSKESSTKKNLSDCLKSLCLEITLVARMEGGFAALEHYDVPKPSDGKSIREILRSDFEETSPSNADIDALWRQITAQSLHTSMASLSNDLPQPASINNEQLKTVKSTVDNQSFLWTQIYPPRSDTPTAITSILRSTLNKRISGRSSIGSQQSSKQRGLPKRPKRLDNQEPNADFDDFCGNSEMPDAVTVVVRVQSRENLPRAATSNLTFSGIHVFWSSLME